MLAWIVVVCIMLVVGIVISASMKSKSGVFFWAVCLFVTICIGAGSVDAYSEVIPDKEQYDKSDRFIVSGGVRSDIIYVGTIDDATIFQVWLDENETTYVPTEFTATDYKLKLVNIMSIPFGYYDYLYIKSTKWKDYLGDVIVKGKAAYGVQYRGNVYLRPMMPPWLRIRTMAHEALHVYWLARREAGMYAPDKTEEERLCDKFGKWVVDNSVSVW